MGKTKIKTVREYNSKGEIIKETVTDSRKEPRTNGDKLAENICSGIALVIETIGKLIPENDKGKNKNSCKKS